MSRRLLLLSCGALFAQSSGDLVVRIEVNLVQVDAVVLDGKNQPVTNLTAADFEIRQDGKRQSIKNFAFIDAGKNGLRAPRERDAALLGHVDLKATDVRRTFAIVVDDLGMAWESFPGVKQALRKFVTEKQLNDLVAIVPTGGGMGVSQQFTSDPKRLIAAIDQLKHNLRYSRIGIESFASISPTTPVGNPLLQGASRVGTMRGLESVLRGLRDLPGRKVLVLFSEDMAFRDDRFVQTLGDLANRASVVIYGIDPRGLPTLSVSASDNVMGDATGRAPPPSIAKISAVRATNYFQSQAGMSYLANETGGLFLHDNNDIGGEMGKVSADSSGYYLIGYQPEEGTFTPGKNGDVFHKLEVRVKRSGLHVRSRAGFFNFPNPPKDEPRTPLMLKTRQGQIESAFNSPFSLDAIHVRLTGRFVETPKEGPMIEGLLYIDAKDLKFSVEADGTKRANVEVVSRLAGGDPQKPDYHANIMAMRFGPEPFQAALKNGITSVFYRPASKPGSYELKIVLRDGDSEQIGSASQFLDVPDLARKELALSGIVMSGANARAHPQGESAEVAESDPGAGPAVRIFPMSGTVLFGYQILNANANENGRPDLMLETRLLHDGKQVYAGPPAAFDSRGQADAARLEVESRLKLGAELVPGDYVLVVAVTDRLAPKKVAAASQSIDFEIRQ